MPAVEVTGLTKEFPLNRSLREILRNGWKSPTKQVLDGLDLTVERGEIVGVLGVNGAGKTTLLKILAGLVRPTEGSAAVCGWDVVKDDKRVKELVSYAFTDERSFYWRLTGWENLEFFAALDGIHGREALTRIRHLSERLGLSTYLDQPFARYSAGVKQRFALARALLSPVELLLLDEPTRSIDLVESRTIRALIKEIARDDGTTVILVTHHPEEAAFVCDRTAVLAGGRIQKQLAPAELERAMTGLSGVTVILDEMGDLELPALERMPGVREVALSVNNGKREIELWCETSETSLSELVGTIASSGAVIRGFFSSASLSEVMGQIADDGARV